MSLQLDDEGFDRSPHNLSPSCWFYESTKGLEIYHEMGVPNSFEGTITWAYIRNALRRKDAARARGGKR